MKDFEMDSIAESKIDDIVANLYHRIVEETERLLESQLEKLGVEDEPGDLIIDNILKYIEYPDDPLALFSYEYMGYPILGAKISENGMAVEWDVPEIKGPAEMDEDDENKETQSKGEVQ